MALPLKPLRFLGSSLDDLRAMPVVARHALGVELMLVQFGGMPSDFKPMPSVGAGHMKFAYGVKAGLIG